MYPVYTEWIVHVWSIKYAVVTITNEFAHPNNQSHKQTKKSEMETRPVTREAHEREDLLENFSLPLEKSVGHRLKLLHIV